MGNVKLAIQSAEDANSQCLCRVPCGCSYYQCVCRDRLLVSNASSTLAFSSTSPNTSMMLNAEQGHDRKDEPILIIESTACLNTENQEKPR
ncbi:hypothetical protein TNCV_51611 [Trichonephila clavipes]|nr:hypothetical protein TNCV_51611 [Trichonephila clavipes]